MIKFRGKRVDDGEEVKGWYTKKWSKTTCLLSPFIEWYGNARLYSVEVIPESVAQYTTINDKKRTEEYPEGQEIYGSIEINGKMSKGGDLVNASTYGDEAPQILEVYQTKGAFVIDYEDSEADIVTVGWFIGSIEVIGRQYDEKGKNDKG